MSRGHVGGQDATNSDTLQVVSLFSRHPASYCVFLLEWFHPACPPSREWWGSGSPMPAPCVTAPRQKVEDRDRHSICTLIFFTCAWELGAWCYERMRDQTTFFWDRAGRGKKLRWDAQLQSCVVWGGDWPLWSLNSRDVSTSPIDTTRVLTFHPINPRRGLPSPPTAWPHPAIWSCVIPSAGRGTPWERRCWDAHTQTCTRTRAHTRLQPSASSAPLHALSFVSSTFFPKKH